MRAKWDTPLNRAFNILKGLVDGVGDDATWKHYYHEDLEAKRQIRKFSQVNIDEKVKLAVEKKQLRPNKRPKKR